jgi:hypothetical protein
MLLQQQQRLKQQQEQQQQQQKQQLQKARQKSASSNVASSESATNTNVKTRTTPCCRMLLRSKRKSPPGYGNGEEWARAKTRLPPHMIRLLARAEEFVADTIEFKVEFSELLRAEANREENKSRGNSAIKKFPIDVCGT